MKAFIFSKQAIENSHYQRIRHRISQKRRAFFPHLEITLSNTIKQRREQGTVVTGIYIVNQAKAIAQEQNIEHFQASKGWLRNFLVRHDLVLRRIASRGKQLPLRTREIIREFHMLCEKKELVCILLKFTQWMSRILSLIVLVYLV